MRHAICYVSTSNSDLSQDQIESLLNSSKVRNEQNDLKGVLLHSEGNFFQIIEGKKEVVLDIFKKISKDPRHFGIIQIVGRDIEEGSYDGYKVDILGDRLKVGYEVPTDYYEALHGIPPHVKKPMEKMLEIFIATR